MRSNNFGNSLIVVSLMVFSFRLRAYLPKSSIPTILWRKNRRRCR